MKKVVLIALVAFAAMACEQKNETTPQPEINSTSVPYRKLTSVPASGAELKVDLREISDSRCPKDVVCIQMGNVQLTLNVSDGTNQTDVKITFGALAKSDTQTFTLSGQAYLLTVSEVLPYPVSTASPTLEDYKISVKIEKK